MTEEDRKILVDELKTEIVNATKEVLTSKEVAGYMGVSQSYIYKLTMRNEIPHYKPMGKICYFNRKEIERWLMSNRVSTDTEISDRAEAYCMRKGGRQ